jgi:polar amino acid transport system substrate-binding protein
LILFSIIFPIFFVGLTPVFSKEIKLVGITGSALGELCLEVMTEVYLRLGYPVNINLFPAKRALEEVSYGNYDANACRIQAVEDKYPSLIRIPFPIMNYQNHGFILKSNDSLADYQDLETIRIGVIRGIVATDRLTKGLKRVLVGNTSDLFNLLLAGRIDMAITSNLSGQIFLGKNPRFVRIKMVDKPIQMKKLHHFVHASNDHLVEELASMLQKMTITGEIATLTKNYINRKSGQPIN